jgi:hypothetical protein
VCERGVDGAKVNSQTESNPKILNTDIRLFEGNPKLFKHFKPETLNLKPET